MAKKKAPERKMVKEMVTTLDVRYVKLGSLLNDVKEMIEQYGPDAEVEPYTERYDPDEHQGGVFVLVPETDQQMEHRLKEEARYAALQAERDRLEFERLSKKFAKG